MSEHIITKCWFTAHELAGMALPGLPRDKRKMTQRAASEKWAIALAADGSPLARLRRGKGGGLEYHLHVLPTAARTELARRSLGGQDAPIEQQQALSATSIWRWYEHQNDRTKQAAVKRVKIVAQVSEMEAAGMAKGCAVAAVAEANGVGAATLWEWLRLISGIAPADWLPCLAPKRRGGGKKAEIDAGLWQIFKSDFLRPEKPTLTSCYERLRALAASEGLDLPACRTFQRRLEREIDPRVIMLRREGKEALRRSMPAQKRSVADLTAMEWVNVDGHKFDVFVTLDDGRIVRPMMVAIQDIYSRKMLAFRLGETESAVQTRLAFADLFRDYGIPANCTLDNGRAFASKWITGGAASRFRFKIREDEPTGLLTSLGINIHWALPYRGQSKPIERGFRDLCDSISRHPACAGAYTGNTVLAKPENYGSKAIPIAEFRRIVTAGIAAHNARAGRRTETAHGQSFDDVFAASYAVAPIGKASHEQLRMALLTAEAVNVDRQTSEIRFYHNRYWSPALSALHGRKIVVRFDPDALHQPLHVYDLSGAYLCAADLIENTGFGDVAGAKARARQEAGWRKAVRDADAMEDLLTADAVAAAYAAPDYPDEPELPEPAVVRPVRHHRTSAALKLAETARPAPRDFSDRFANAISHLKIVE